MSVLSIHLGRCCICHSVAQGLLNVQGKQLEATVRSEHLAEAGDVDGSMAQMQQAEAFQKQHESLHKQFTTPERVMAVCDVCAVFINSTDNDQRRAVRLLS